jgi:hypothetical protein
MASKGDDGGSISAAGLLPPLSRQVRNCRGEIQALKYQDGFELSELLRRGGRSFKSEKSSQVIASQVGADKALA